MSLSPQQSRGRRFALLASGVCSVTVLALALAFPFWNADAGGLEREERARLAKERREHQNRDAKRATRPERTTERPSRADAPRGNVPTPLPSGEPVAIPVPREPGERPAPPQRTAQPRPLPPPLPPQQDQRAAETTGTGVSLDAMKALFRRPPAQRALRGQDSREVLLGHRLFNEKKLSADHRMSCATCHDPGQSFTDGRRTARGNKGQNLPRNTPSIWNLERARAFYWDGRSPTLEAQIKDAIERPGEMDATLEAAVLWLSRDPSYVQEFQATYGNQNALNGDNLLKAMAAYERTLVSPDTRFDRFIDGDVYALNERELAGFRLFTGKARCLACHGGWRFTDDIFHDVGLRSKDPGRQAIAGGAERAFKTPSLREVMWSAPYMHDGSLKTIEDVVAHYAGKLEDRPSLAPELKRGIVLSEAERGQLVAFLKTLSSESGPPKTPPLPTR